jgi:hypothetical protein
MGVDVSAQHRTMPAPSGLLIALSVIALMLFIRADRLHAECLILPPPCEAMKRDSVVVLAQVLDSKAPWDQPRRSGEHFMRNDVRIEVLERFKGLAENQREISISIPWTSESLGLAQDRVYLVFAFVNSAGDWQTACTRTRQVSADDDEIRVLRQCR